LADFEAALAIAPDLGHVHFLWGVALYQLKRYEEALTHFTAVLAEHPDHEDTLVYSGLALIRTGQNEAGHSRLLAALKRDPWNPQIMFMLGVFEQSRDNPKTARSWFEKALDQQKDFTDAAMNLGLALCELGDTEEAVRTMRPLVRNHPDSPEILFFYGMALYRHGDLAEATSRFKQALSLKPDYTDAMLGLAEIYVKQGQPDAAHALLDELLTLAPDAIPALFLKGMIFSRQGEVLGSPECFEQARNLFLRILFLNPDDTDTRVNLAFVTGMLGDIEGMNQQFESLVQDPNLDKEAMQGFWDLANQHLAKTQGPEQA